MNNYESIVILNAKVSEEDKASFIEKEKALISENGQLTKVDDWGRKILAYEIKKEKEGYYLLFTFEVKPEFIAEYERILRLDDIVLKHIVIKK